MAQVGATKTRQSRGRGAASQPSAEDLKLLEQIRSGALRVAPEDGRPAESGSGADRLRAFTLAPEQIASVEQGRGRKPVDPAYLADMREMIDKPGEYAGYQITTASPATLITSKIRRAARECDLETSDYSVYVRAKEGFVAFSVHQTEA